MSAAEQINSGAVEEIKKEGRGERRGSLSLSTCKNNKQSGYNKEGLILFY